MADPLLTSLCSICHVSAPRYTCPRCKTRTCSLTCVKKHKAWSECSGERDPTVYKQRRELRTPAGIDHDYNFLHGLERTVERTEKMLVEEKGLLREDDLRKQPPLTVQELRWRTDKFGRKKRVLVTRELREQSGAGARSLERHLALRLKKLDVTVLFAPTGLQRQKENHTTFNRKTSMVNWQVEWLDLQTDGSTTGRKLSKVLEDLPIYKAYHQVLDQQSKKKAAAAATRSDQTQTQTQTQTTRGKRFYNQLATDSTWNTPDDLLQEPISGRWVPSSSVRESNRWPDEADRERRQAFDYYLSRARQRSGEPKVVSRLDAKDCLRDVLQHTTVLEFPTIYAFQGGATLPGGFVLGSQEASAAAQGGKRKDAPQKGGPRAAKRRKQDRQELEDGEVSGEGDDDDKSSVGTGGGGHDEQGDGGSVGLEVGDVVAEESYDEDGDGDEDDPTSSSGSDGEDD